MSASRTGRPRAACRSTNRAASTAAVASAALPTAYARTRPPVTTTDRSRPSTSNSSTNVDVADLVDQPVHVEPGPGRSGAVRDADQTPAVLDGLLQPGPFTLQQARRLVVVPGLGQPTVVGAQGSQEAGQLAVTRRSSRGLGQRTPPALAPPQLRPRAARRPRGVSASRASSSPCTRRQRAQLGAAERGPMVVEGVQSTAAGVPHPSQLVCAGPGRAPRRATPWPAPARTDGDGSGRRPPTGPSRRPARHRRPPGRRATTRPGRPLTVRPPAAAPARAAVVRERIPLATQSSPGRQHHQLGPGGRHLSPLAPEAVRARLRAASRAARASPRASSAKAR